MKKRVRIACGLSFIGVCVAVFAFLHAFTVPPASMRYLTWSSSMQVRADGTETPYAPETYAPPEASDGDTYRFSLTLPADIGDGALFFETSGLEIALYMDGTLLYRAATTPQTDVVALAQARIPLSSSAAGRTLVAHCRPLGGNGLFPPLLRFTDDITQEADIIAYAHLSGIPAGAFGFAFVLICGLFLLGVAWGKPDFRLLPLLLAALGQLLHPIAQACGVYFLPEGLLHIATWNGIDPLVLLSLAVYLGINRKRDFGRPFGWISLCSGALLLVGYVVSRVRGGYLAGYIDSELTHLFQSGSFGGLIYWGSFWLVIVCTLISAHALTHAIAKMQTDAQTLALREQLAMENHRLMERRLRETAALRHETQHQFATLDALYRKGDLDGLSVALTQLQQTYTAHQPIVYTEHFALNALLQNMAAQSAQADIRFEAVALVPKDLPFPEGDLCGLVMNLLDNAFEAACAVTPPDARFIRFRAEWKGCFLALRCANAYRGPLKLSPKGWPQTTKSEPENHGFGLPRMREIAEKYGSILDLFYTDDTFTVQTALCLPGTGAPSADPPKK